MRFPDDGGHHSAGMTGTLGGRRDEPAPAGAARGMQRIQQDGGLRLPQACPRGGPERLTACGRARNVVDFERQIFPTQEKLQLKERRTRPEPNWSEIRAELARRDHPMTPAVLWQEDKAERPDVYQNSQYCDLYRRFEPRPAVILRAAHASGKKSCVDFCGRIPADQHRDRQAEPGGTVRMGAASSPRSPEFVMIGKADLSNSRPSLVIPEERASRWVTRQVRSCPHSDTSDPPDVLQSRPQARRPGHWPSRSNASDLGYASGLRADSATNAPPTVVSRIKAVP